MLTNYIKIAFRNLQKQKFISAINIFGLAIGITCCILILLWVSDELSFDTFHKNADRIFRVVKLNTEGVEQGIARVGAPWGPALKQDYPEVQSYVRFRYYGRALLSRGQKQFYASEGLYADTTLFDIFTFPLVEGSEKNALAQPNSLVITKHLAEKFFGSESAIGKTLLLENEDEYQITAVVDNIPHNSHFEFDFLVPFNNYSRWDLTEWRINNFHLYLLLSKKNSARELEKKLPEFVDKYIGKEVFEGSSAKLQRLTDVHLHSHLLREFKANGSIETVYMFCGIALFVLLIACINFMNLATARSMKRAREVGIRKVVGSRRHQLIKQFLFESIFQSFVAVVIAIVLVELILPFFNSFSGKELNIQYTENLSYYLSLVSLVILVGFLSGLYPAFFLSSFKPVSMLKGNIHSVSAGTTLRKGLVILQFTISIALIVMTALVYKQIKYVNNKNLGFNPEQVLVVRMNESAVKEKIKAFRNELLQDPNIVGVSASSNLLGGSDWGMPFKYENRGEEERFQSRTLVVDDHFLETLNIKLIQGRNFSAEYATDTSAAYILNETAANLLGWKNNPIGNGLARPDGKDAKGEWLYKKGKVVGVVKDFHFRSLHQEIQPMVMFWKPSWFNYLSIRIRTENLDETMAYLEKKWAQFENEWPFDHFFLEEIFDQMYRAERRLGKTFAAFSSLAVFIACLGLFGMASFLTELRTKEIGVRKILGASVFNLFTLLSKDFTQWVLFGNILAWPIAYVLMRSWLGNFAYKIQMGWWVFIAAGIATLLIALITISYQIIKTALTNPVNALRYE